MKISNFICVILLSAIMIGCGGGGSDEPEVVQDPIVQTPDPDPNTGGLEPTDSVISSGQLHGYIKSSDGTLVSISGSVTESGMLFFHTHAKFGDNYYHVASALDVDDQNNVLESDTIVYSGGIDGKQYAVKDNNGTISNGAIKTGVLNTDILGIEADLSVDGQTFILLLEYLDTQEPITYDLILGSLYGEIDGGGLSLTFDAEGNISGNSASGCVMSGTAFIENDLYNAYSLDMVASNCDHSGNYTGVASLEYNGNYPSVVHIQFSNESYSFWTSMVW